MVRGAGAIVAVKLYDAERNLYAPLYTGEVDVDKADTKQKKINKKLAYQPHPLQHCFAIPAEARVVAQPTEHTRAQGFASEVAHLERS